MLTVDIVVVACGFISRALIAGGLAVHVALRLVPPRDPRSGRCSWARRPGELLTHGSSGHAPGAGRLQCRAPAVCCLHDGRGGRSSPTACGRSTTRGRARSPGGAPRPTPVRGRDHVLRAAGRPRAGRRAGGDHAAEILGMRLIGARSGSRRPRIGRHPQLVFRVTGRYPPRALARGRARGAVAIKRCRLMLVAVAVRRASGRRVNCGDAPGACCCRWLGFRGAWADSFRPQASLAYSNTTPKRHSVRRVQALGICVWCRRIATIRGACAIASCPRWDARTSSRRRAPSEQLMESLRDLIRRRCAPRGRAVAVGMAFRLAADLIVPVDRAAACRSAGVNSCRSGEAGGGADLCSRLCSPSFFTTSLGGRRARRCRSCSDSAPAQRWTGGVLAGDPGGLFFLRGTCGQRD